MAIGIGELRAVLSLQDSFSAPLKDAAKGITSFGDAMKVSAGLAGAAVASVGAATAAIVALGVRGAAIADVKQAFEGLAGGAGQAADAMLGALQEGTLSTISNFELMKLANKALGTGLIKSASDMGTLASGAKLLADRTGGDTREAFETLTSAMASGRTAQLKQLGLFVDSKVAVEQYAIKLGKSVGDLSDHERATALSQGALAALKTEMEESGVGAADFGDKIERGKVALQNLADGLAQAVAASPVVAAGLDAIARAFDQAFGGDQQETIQTLMGFVNRFAIVLVQAAEVGVEAARFLTNAFSGTKVIFNAFLQDIFHGIAGVTGVIADLAEKAAKLPLNFGAGFAEIGKSFRASTDLANSLSLGFGQMSQSALDSAAASNVAFDQVQAGLAGVEAEMRKALTAENELAAAAPVVAAGMTAMGEATALTAAQIKAMEDTVRQTQEATLETTDFMTDAFIRLQEELTLANTFGLERRLAEIEIARQKEIAGMQVLAFMYPEEYEKLVVTVTEKYAQMGAAAQGFFTTAAGYAAANGFKTRAEMEATVAAALFGFIQMQMSGEYTAAAITAAWEKYTKAKQELDGKVVLSSMQQFELLASSASGILRGLFAKSKTAAIAAAIIDTAAAVIKTFVQSGGWPWGLIPAAAMAAAGYAQIQKIRSQNAGFAEGSPGTRFEDFGRGSTEMLHGSEAVVTPGQAESVGGMIAGMVSAAIRDAQGRGSGGGETVLQPLQVNLDGSRIGDVLLRLSRTGAVRISEHALVP